MKSLIAVSLFCVFCLAWPLHAEGVCGPHKDIADTLKNDYGEHLAAQGIDHKTGALIEIYTSLRRTWTILATKPGKQTCVIKAGEHWQGELKYQQVHGTESWAQNYTTQWSQVQKDDYGWAMRAKNGEGISCCGKNDLTQISHADANQAVVGSVITADFNGIKLDITVTAIYPTEDRQGRAWLSRFGCLFRVFGM